MQNAKCKIDTKCHSERSRGIYVIKVTFTRIDLSASVEMTKWGVPQQMQNAECHSKCRMQNATANAKCKMQNAKLNVKNLLNIKE